VDGTIGWSRTERLDAFGLTAGAGVEEEEIGTKTSSIDPAHERLFNICA